MANQRMPNDPYRSSNDPYRPNLAGDDIGSPAPLDNELQPDPELAEGPAGSGRIALFAIGIAVILGAVFYGLNNTSINQASTAPPAQTAQTQTAPPPAPAGMRDVTPHANSQPNSQPGVTTGAATNRPTPPTSGPTGSELDRSANPSAGQNNDNR
ncbi:hypothetical protein [Bradyrhizobium canariense]|uniref:Uncharacterized protein n=1 Tax=Bradyrhizobium canariense TaxID=255045 RepID=A0A1H1NSF0_9BRAD|nr:hypothetical protein [Bradyrhizobium canariense]SDS01887.1 hypothetical protein SAMN05444158_0742 [Bradyrhizobium canariense]